MLLACPAGSGGLPAGRNWTKVPLRSAAAHTNAAAIAIGEQEGAAAAGQFRAMQTSSGRRAATMAIVLALAAGAAHDAAAQASPADASRTVVMGPASFAVPVTWLPVASSGVPNLVQFGVPMRAPQESVVSFTVKPDTLADPMAGHRQAWGDLQRMTGAPQQERWGTHVTLNLPGGCDVMVYEPHHPIAAGMGRKKAAKKKSAKRRGSSR